MTCRLFIRMIDITATLSTLRLPDAAMYPFLFILRGPLWLAGRRPASSTCITMALEFCGDGRPLHALWCWCWNQSLLDNTSSHSWLRILRALKYSDWWRGRRQVEHPTICCRENCDAPLIFDASSAAKAITFPIGISCVSKVLISNEYKWSPVDAMFQLFCQQH